MPEQLLELFEAYLENRLTDCEAGELRDMLRSSNEARQLFWEYVEQHSLIADVLAEARGRDLAVAETSAFSSARSARTLPVGRVWLYAGGLAAVAAALLLAVGLSWHPAAAAPLATVRSLGGEVQVIDLSGTTAPVTADTMLSAGQRLHVGDKESRAEVVFADGAKIVLGSGTDVRFPAPGPAEPRQLHLDRGAVLVQATTLTTQAPLIVTTDQARITAAGTRFRLYRELAASRVEMQEGKVRLETQSRAIAVEVAEGSFVVATDQPRPVVPQPLPQGDCRLRHTFLRGGDAVAFSNDSTTLVAHHFSRGWKAWDLRDGMLRAAAPGSGQRTGGLALTPARETALHLGNNGAVAFWKIGALQAVHTALCDKQLRCNATSADGRWLAQGSGREVVLWEADPDKGSISLRQTLAVKASRVALSSTGPLLAISRWGGEITVHDGITGRQVIEYRLSRTPTPLLLSPDGRFLAAFAQGDGLVLFDRRSGARHTLWPGEGTRVEALDFSADGRLLLAGLGDGTVRAWATEDGSSWLVLDTGHRVVTGVALSPDRMLLATVGDNDCVKVWGCRLP